MIRCSFCAKASDAVGFMVAREGEGPGLPAICDECVYLTIKHMVAAGWIPPELKVSVVVKGPNDP